MNNRCSFAQCGSHVSCNLAACHNTLRYLDNAFIAGNWPILFQSLHGQFMLFDQMSIYRMAILQYLKDVEHLHSVSQELFRISN